MTDEQNERAARVAKVIAKAMGDNFADAFKNKQRWTAKHGMSGGRFRDINEPFQSDYLAAAEAAIAVIAREFEAMEAENARLRAFTGSVLIRSSRGLLGVTAFLRARGMTYASMRRRLLTWPRKCASGGKLPVPRQSRLTTAKPATLASWLWRTSC